MLGSHDSFTYMTARNKIVNTFSSFWRCQSKTIKEQYDSGVRVFDVRVNKDIQNGKFTWQVSHGLAKFNQNFVNLNAICSYFKRQYPDAYVRIVLESGSDDEEVLTKFKTQAKKAYDTYKSNLWCIIIKNPWETLYVGKQFKQVNDYCCRLFNWDPNKELIENIKNFDVSSYSIHSWAKSHNPDINKQLIENPDVLYFMDYV